MSGRLTKALWRAVPAVVGLCAASGVAWAQQTGGSVTAPQQASGVAEAPGTQPSEVDATEPVRETPIAVSTQPVPASTDWVDRVKRPVPWFNWGFDERWRHEYLNNAFSLDHRAPNREWNYQRYRSRLWGTLSPIKELDINMRIAWESRYWWKPIDREGYQANNLVIDNINFKLKQPGGLPMTLTAGRQDIILGDGWLVLDGTPLDGSRTIFFDAVRATFDLKDVNTTADVIYVQNYSDANKYWPPTDITDRVIEQDEKGAILYVTNRSIKKTEIGGHFIYKHNDAVLANGDDGDLYTFGSRVTRDFLEHWRARAEGAIQFGNNRLRDVWAGGFNSNLSYLFNDKWNNQLFAQYEFLSGDDPDTETNEQFNPLWGRWPQWSELMIYQYSTETRIAEVTNLHRLGVGWLADPTKKLQVSARYNLLFADENSYPGRAGFGTGCLRGHLTSLVARYKFNRFLSGHIIGEYFQPCGDYYAPNRDDAAVFARAELIFAF